MKTKKVNGINMVWRVLLPCMLLISCNTAGIDEDQVQHSPFVPEGYAIAFSDEFQSLTLDTEASGAGNWIPWWSGWGVRHLEGNNDKAWKCDISYTGEGDEPLGVVLHEKTDSSTLRLYGRETPADKLPIVSDFPYLGGMISGAKSFSTTYGYFEVKARFEVSKGIHWALWLLPIDDSWPPEIDMVEIVGHQPELIHVNAHGVPGGSPMISTPVQNAAEYHVFGFEWNESEMIWTLDGVEVKREFNYVDKPMYLLLSPEIGGNWPGMPDETTIWPTLCELDYVRIYQQERSEVTASSE